MIKAVQIKFCRIREWIEITATTQRSRQILALYSGMILQTVLGVITSIIIARSLKPQQYGDYSYLANLFNLVLLLVTTGHYVSMSMILAQDENKDIVHDVLGASLVISFGISLIYTTVIFIFSFFQDSLFSNKLGYSLRCLTPFLLLFPLQVYLENAFTGLNKIRELTYFKVLPRIGYVISLVVYIYVTDLNFFSALILLLLTSYVIFLFQLIKLKPSFNNLKQNLAFMSKENKRYGFHIYMGSLANVATPYLSTLSIGYFSNNLDLGYYNLALNITTPLGLLPSVVAATYFKEFASLDNLPTKIMNATLFLAIGSYLIFVLFIRKIIVLFYTVDYINSVNLTYILGIGLIINGCGDIYNRFLCAKARGKDIRNGAFVTGFVNVILFLVLVPMLKSTGAAITRTIIGLVYFYMMYFYYNKYINTTRSNSC